MKKAITNYLKKPSLMFIAMVFAFTGWAQRSINGTVTDESGIPLPGVSVVVKGTSAGVPTNVDGKFSLVAPANATTLVFTFIGMKPHEELINGRSTIDVKLLADAIGLEEVVAIGYGTQKKVTITGAVSSVGSDELVQSPSASIGNSLAGRVTGLSSIQYSGQPGADAPELFIRGVGSLTTDRSSPLMLVDGVERSFDQLDADEIESISVLKDASATAVFGVRGANGVIIVTTKRGTLGPVSITASASFGVQVPTRLLDFTDSYTYALRYNEAMANDGGNPFFSEKAIEAFRTNSDPIIYPNMDWMTYMMKPYAPESKQNVNISGGTQRVKYFVSLGNTYQGGMFETFSEGKETNFSYNRFNYRSNLDIDVTKTTKVSLTFGGRVGIKNEPNGQSELFRTLYWAVPFSGAGIVDGKWIKTGTTYIPGTDKKEGLTPFYGLGYINQTQNTLNLDISLLQKLDMITKGLSFRMKGAYNTFYSQTKTRASSIAYYQPYYIYDVDPTYPATDNTIVYKKQGSDGTLSYGESFGRDRDWYAEAGFNYDRAFGVHHFTGLILYNQSKNFYPTQYPDISAGLVGLVGRVTYDYSSRYLFDLNMGYNGSENFAPDKRFGFFPAASVGWVLTEESFMKDLKFFEYVKFRGSYGVVGNDKLGNNRFLYLPDSYSPNSGGYNFGTDNPNNQIVATEGKVGNPYVSWEKAYKQNYGVDLKFFKARLGLNFDYFIENREDILWSRSTVPGFVAYDLPAVNLGKTKNQGYEIAANWRETVKEFTYWVNFNLSYAKNKIVFQDEIPQNEPYLYRTGKPVGQPFGYVTDRFYGVDDVLPDGVKPGDLKFKDLNNDGKINTDDQMAIGYPVYPEYTMGTTIGMKWKNIDLTMLWVGATHTSRMLGDIYKTAFGETGNRSLLQYMADGRWTPETAANATYPRMSLAGATYNAKASDFWLKDASYLRLKNIELGYNIKAKALRSIGIKNLRAYLNGYNLITFDKLKIADPESKTATDSQYPIVKIYNIGLKVDF
jgi:TonB-linked SusC/RagA family outer membrane protein